MRRAMLERPEHVARRPGPMVRPMPRPASALQSEASELRRAQQGAGNAAMIAAARAAGAGEHADILPSPAALYAGARLALEQRPEADEPGRPGPASAYDSIIAMAHGPGARAGAENPAPAANGGRYLQAKLEVSTPEDPLEREADTVADTVMRMPAQPAEHGGPPVTPIGSARAIHRACAECHEQDEETASPTMVQPMSAGREQSRSAVPAGLGARIDSLHGRGTPLAPAARAWVEPHLGRDLSSVRVHTDAEAGAMAQALSARAFTVGSDIVFAPGQYAPGSPAGQRLLAHELTHVVQQSGGAARPAATTPAAAHPGTMTSAPGRTARRMIQRAWYHRVGSAVASGARAVGGTVTSGARAVGGAVVSGARWTGGKVAAGAEWAYDTAADKFGAAWDCARSTGHSVARLVTGDFKSLSDLLGIPEPAGDDPDSLDAIVAAMRHPCVRMLPGSSLLTGAARKARDAKRFLAGAWKMVQNPDPVIAAIRTRLAGYMTAIPGLASAMARKAITFSEPPPGHMQGIWRHLEPKLAYLQEHWWDVIKEMAWDLLWPWPGAVGDLVAMWGNVKAAASALWGLRVSAAVDEILALWRNANSLGGRLYGWFLIASVLIGAIIGAFFGGAGAVPGAAAGFAFATELGMGLLISTAAADGATLAKSGFDLVFTTQTDEENEHDYELIASSSLSLAILGALVALGALAARFGRGVLARVAGLFRRKKPPPDGSMAAETASGTPRAGGVPAELASVSEPMTLAGKPHRLSIKRLGERLVLWLCSPTCGELIARCGELLKTVTDTNARAEIEQILKRVRLVEKRLNKNKITATEADAELDRLARKLEGVASKDPAGVGQVLEAEAPARDVAPPGEAPTEYVLPNGEKLSYRGLDPDVPMSSNLQGEGQIAALERNPNLKGIGVRDILTSTPKQLAQMVESGRISKKVFNAIMKAGEGRDLRHGQ